MKKILGISLVAVLAATPLMASADPVATVDPAHADSAAVTTTEPGYALAEADANDGNVATAGYVKGAYNAAIKAVNKVAATAGTALQKTDITTGSADGTISVDGTDVAVHGLGSAAYTDSTAYATAAQGTTADNTAAKIGNVDMTTTATTLTGAVKELKDSIDGIDTSLAGYATKTGVENTIKGTNINVTNNAVSYTPAGNVTVTLGNDTTSSLTIPAATATVPTLTVWGNDSSTGTATATAETTTATVVTASRGVQSASFAGTEATITSNVSAAIDGASVSYAEPAAQQ